MQATIQKIVLISLVIVSMSSYIYRKNIYECWMQFSLRDEHIVISLTTTPHRINSLEKVLDFILNEPLSLKSIYISIPYVFKRDNIEYIIPEWLYTKDPRIKILRTKDYGPATKLLGALEQLNLAANSIVITIDDDNNYPKNMLLYLAYKAKNNPNFAIGLSGMRPHYNKQGKIITDSPTGIGLKAVKENNAFVPILEGFAGIAYRPKFFDETIFEIENAPRECRNSDDVYISYYLARKNIPRQVLRSKFMRLEKISWDPVLSLGIDSIHQQSPRPALRHRICLEFLKSNYPNIEF